MKTIFITFLMVVNLTALSQTERLNQKMYCNLLTKTISYMSSVNSEIVSYQSLFDDEEGCFMNGIQYGENQTYSNFHADLVKFFKESGTPAIETITPWQLFQEKGGYVTSFRTIYDDSPITVLMFYNIKWRVCTIRVWGKR